VETLLNWGIFLLLKLNIPTARNEPVIVCSVANLVSDTDHYTTALFKWIPELYQSKFKAKVEVFFD
jgi:hypothetical protein